MIENESLEKKLEALEKRIEELEKIVNPCYSPIYNYKLVGIKDSYLNPDGVRYLVNKIRKETDEKIKDALKESGR